MGRYTVYVPQLIEASVECSNNCVRLIVGEAGSGKSLFLRLIAASLSLPRLGTNEEIADAAGHLSGEEAAWKTFEYSDGSGKYEVYCDSITWKCEHIISGDLPSAIYIPDLELIKYGAQLNCRESCSEIRRIFSHTSLSTTSDKVNALWRLHAKGLLDYDVVLLDNPTAGVHMRDTLRAAELVAELASRGSDVFVATHDLFFIDAVARAVEPGADVLIVLMERGRVAETYNTLSSYIRTYTEELAAMYGIIVQGYKRYYIANPSDTVVAEVRRRYIEKYGEPLPLVFGFTQREYDMLTALLKEMGFSRGNGSGVKVVIGASHEPHKDAKMREEWVKQI